MNVLHIVAGELTEGASRGAYWLHRGLLALDVESRLFTNSKQTYGDASVTTVSDNAKGFALSMLRKQVDLSLATLYPEGKRGTFSNGLLGVDFIRTPEYQAADVIHLHWINAGMVNMKTLGKIDKPIIWTLRDMWPMTGGCHYAMSCEKFTDRCGSCPQLGSNMDYDLSRFVFKRKARYLPPNMYLVGISNWISEQARRSTLFRDADVRTIYNNIDTTEFFPVDKQTARDLLGIRTEKKIVLAGCTSTKDEYKGFGKYLEALKSLDPARYHLCFFGKLDQAVAESLGFDFTSFGYLHDSIALRLAYACADVFVAPSLMEAFGKTIAEAMACGTPVACFDATGPKDIVSHQQDGYKAKPFDAQDLAAGIEWLAHAPDHEALCRNARKNVVAQFDSLVVARQYFDLYEEVLACEAVGSMSNQPQPS